MSHKHTVLEPAKGLTVIVGPNNVGKSAVVAALQILCHNDDSTYVMRHGAKSCSVSVTTDEGHEIQWCRKQAPSYVIDGQQFDRLNRSVPDELHAVLRMPRIDASNQEGFDIHIGAQKSPIFLLDKSGSTAATFFASSSDASRLVEMQRLHKQKVRDNRNEKSRLDVEHQQLSGELKLLEDVPSLESQLTHLENLREKIERESQRMGKLTADRSELLSAIQSQGKCQTEAKSLVTLSPPPQLEDCDALKSLIEKMQNEQRSLTTHRRELQCLIDLAPNPVLPPTSHFEELLKELRSALQNASQSNSVISSLADLSRPPELEDVQKLQIYIEQLRILFREYELCSKVIDQSESLAPPPQFSPTARLTSLIEQIEQWDLQIQKHQIELSTLDLPTFSPEVDPADLSSLHSQLKHFEERRRLRQVELQLLSRLSHPPVESLTSPLSDLIHSLSESEDRADRLNEEHLICLNELQMLKREIDRASSLSSSQRDDGSSNSLFRLSPYALVTIGCVLLILWGQSQFSAVNDDTLGEPPIANSQDAGKADPTGPESESGELDNSVAARQPDVRIAPAHESTTSRVPREQKAERPQTPPPPGKSEEQPPVYSPRTSPKVPLTLMNLFDQDGNGALTQNEIEGSGAQLRKLDENRDGVITQQELDRNNERQPE